MEILNVFPTEEINYQVQQILASPAFKNSPILSKFLAFIVSETLLEREQNLKEYNIARNVLNRTSSFNPQDDAIVRIHAGRLRRALNEYYMIQGINAPIIINVPKGGYVPCFEAGTTEKPGGKMPSTFSEPAINPILAVFPFRTVSERQNIQTLSLILADQLSAELSRFRDISVIGYYSSEVLAKAEQNILEAGRSVGADYIITGSIQYNDQNLRILINLLNASTGEVMMVRSFEKENISSGMFEWQDEIIQSVSGVLGGYDGIIFREMAKAIPGKASNNSGVRKVIYSYNKYKRSYSVENFNSVLSLLQQAVKDNPDHAVSWAMLGELHLDGIGLGIKNGDDSLAYAYQCALRSFKSDPLCQHAWYTLAGVHLFRKEKEACMHSARQCIDLNPNSSSLVAGVAFMLICAGYFEDGFSIMEKAAKAGSHDPLWISGGGCFYYLHKQKYESALFWAEKINSEETFWDPLLKCVAFSYLDKKEEARRYLVKLLEMEPEAPRKIGKMLSTFLLSDSLKRQILNGLKKVGFQEDVLIPG